MQITLTVFIAGGTQRILRCDCLTEFSSPFPVVLVLGAMHLITQNLHKYKLLASSKHYAETSKSVKSTLRRLIFIKQEAYF